MALGNQLERGAPGFSTFVGSAVICLLHSEALDGEINLKKTFIKMKYSAISGLHKPVNSTHFLTGSVSLSAAQHPVVVCKCTQGDSLTPRLGSQPAAGLLAYVFFPQAQWRLLLPPASQAAGRLAAVSGDEEDEQLITATQSPSCQTKLTGVTLLFHRARARPGPRGVD